MLTVIARTPSAEILIRDSQQPVSFESNRQCEVDSESWKLAYSGGVITDPSQIDIDHVIPLKWAHGHGGGRWTLKQQQGFANDPDNLLANVTCRRETILLPLASSCIHG